MDKEALLGRKASDTRSVPIDGVGDVVVRGLTRGEVKAVNADYKGDDRENALISLALVDPVLTVDEVATWLDEAPAGDSVAVMNAVAELSGMAEGSAQKSVPRPGGRGRRR